MRISDWSSDVCSSDLTSISPTMTRLRIGLCSADHLKSFPRAPAITQINVLRPFDPGDCMDQTRRARSDAPQRGRTLRRRTICADLTAMLEAGGCARQPRDQIGRAHV